MIRFAIPSGGATAASVPYFFRQLLQILVLILALLLLVEELLGRLGAATAPSVSNHGVCSCGLWHCLVLGGGAGEGAQARHARQWVLVCAAAGRVQRAQLFDVERSVHRNRRLFAYAMRLHGRDNEGFGELLGVLHHILLLEVVDLTPIGPCTRLPRRRALQFLLFLLSIVHGSRNRCARSC